ncbi:hypothetical protein WH50_14155 [Pokkaliibacter plantistimulans]|uniref:HPP transmembrane region domain-containing protein n=1 Tax=Pokkaliibacter plantistimulans TaxID=1635171 RepID=A0ABX5LYW7_9GAMM|nr:HPP family protein [Pokkaliibacter plantistimulans]PXF30648.1 hypothetical protein WH50_14155 [Pokkaliibacter plantistimulans]
MKVVVSHTLKSLLAGSGAALGIAALVALDHWLNWVLLMVPFGASCVLLFAVPSSPLSRPQNVIGGHVLTACIGVVIAHLGWPLEYALPMAAGAGVAAMMALQVVHPPAGANPLLVLFSGMSWPFVWHTVLPGSVLLVVLAWAYHHLAGHRLRTTA